MMRHHDVLALLWAVAFSLLFAGAAFGQDAGLDVFNEVSAEKHETLSEIRGACSQADAVIRASRELDECKPNSKGRTALKELAAAMKQGTCADLKALPLELERARQLADNAALSLQLAVASRDAAANAAAPPQQARLDALTGDVDTKDAANKAAAGQLARAIQADREVRDFHAQFNRV